MSLLEELVKRYSPTGETSEVASFLVQALEERGFDARVDSAGNVVAERGKGKTILLVGHMDTVPGEIEVRVENNKLYGRGSVDAKGCLATFVEAADGFKGRVVFAACCDEEGVSNGAREIAKNYNPDFVVVGEPSSWDAITIGYKGSLNAVLELEQDVSHSASGSRSVGDRALEFVNELRRFHTGDSFSDVNVSVRDFVTESDGLTESVRVHVCLRVPPKFNTAEVDAVAEKFGARFVQHVPAVLSDKNNDLVRAFLNSIREQGGEPRFKKKTGTADMNVFASAWDCPILAFGPGDSSLDHTPNEHLSLGEFERAVSVLRGVLRGLSLS